MRITRHTIPVALVLVSLAVGLSCTLRKRPEMSSGAGRTPVTGPAREGDRGPDAVRRPGSYPVPDPDRRRAPSVEVRVVPSEVTFPEVRHLITPEAEALAAELRSTET